MKQILTQTMAAIMFIGVAFSLAAVQAEVPQQDTMMKAVPLEVQIGKMAPDFTATAADGSQQSLSSFKGKTVVLEWFNKDCPFVRKHYETNNMQNLQKELTAQGVVWLTINSSAPGKQGHETAEEALATIEEKQLASTHMLLDPEGTIGHLYHAKTTPHMFVINPEGILAYAGAIDDKSSAFKEDVEGAKNYVREAVTAIANHQTVAMASTTPYGCSVKYAH